MKKYIFSLFTILILSFLITPNVSLAQSTSPTDTDPNPSASCVSIQNNLRYRDRDSAKSGEVSTLQDFLQSKGYLNSEPTGYMGLLTFQAVKDYQKSKGISPTGYVGPSTRAAIAGDCGGGNPDPVLPSSSDGCLPGYKYSSTTGKPCDDATVTPTTPTPSITVLSPNGGEIFHPRDILHVKWSYNNIAINESVAKQAIMSISIFSSSYIGTTIFVPNTGTADYEIPKDIPLGNGYKIRVKLGASTPIQDESNDYFTITSSTIDDGCSSGQNYSLTTGKDCGCLYGEVYSSKTGKACNSNTPVISGVSGPQSLNIDEIGTWTVNASNPNGGILSYSVDWGDIQKTCSSSGATCSSAYQKQIQQSAMFTHSYFQAGNYTVVFTVTNSSGQSAKTSLSVKVGNTPTPSITILSPNGGESIDMSNPLYVMFKTNNAYPAKHYINLVDETVGKSYSLDSLLGSYGVSFTQDQIQLQQVQLVVPFIAKSYSLNTSDKYKIEICVNNICDKSDNYFTITSTTTGPTISSVSGPQTLTVGQQGTWTVNASDKNEGTLTYSVDWGDAATRSGCTGACATNSILSSQQSATFTHTYTTAGTYTATFKVTNSSGQSVGTSISVNVIGKTTPTEVLSNPVLNTSMSTRSQNVPVGPNGANNIVRVTYDLSTGNSDVGISEIKYVASGTPNSITTITSGSVSAPVICQTGATCSAYLTGLNIVIPANTTKSIDAYISYAGVGVNGITSGSTAQIQMTYVKYFYNGITGSLNFNSETSPLMTLVSADPTPVNYSPVLGPITVPVGINVGQSVNFNFSATDANNDNLSWSVDWGESPYMSGACSTTNSQQKQGWTWSGNHTWNTAGTYNAKVTVSDCKGGEVSKSFYVTVINPQPYVQVLYPKGGESSQAGSTMRIQWRATGITSNANSIAVQVFKANSTNSYYGVAPVFSVTWSNTVEGSIISDTGFYDWAIPSSFSAGQYVVMVGGGPYGLKAYGEPFSITSSSAPGGGISIPVAGIPLSSNALSALENATSTEPQTQTEENVSLSCTAFTKVLAKGMNDSEIKCLQKMLGEKGFKVEGVESGKETSYFGYATLMALKKFQTANGLRADGIFGPASSTALLK